MWHVLERFEPYRLIGDFRARCDTKIRRSIARNNTRGGVQVIRLVPRSPNPNAYAERRVRSARGPHGIIKRCAMIRGMVIRLSPRGLSVLDRIFGPSAVGAIGTRCLRQRTRLWIDGGLDMARGMRVVLDARRNICFEIVTRSTVGRFKSGFTAGGSSRSSAHRCCAAHRHARRTPAARPLRSPFRPSVRAGHGISKPPLTSTTCPVT
jgi:hypothetical protein